MRADLGVLVQERVELGPGVRHSRMIAAVQRPTRRPAHLARSWAASALTAGEMGLMARLMPCQCCLDVSRRATSRRLPVVLRAASNR
jgi:hypothetical protein